VARDDDESQVGKVFAQGKERRPQERLFPAVGAAGKQDEGAIVHPEVSAGLGECGGGGQGGEPVELQAAGRLELFRTDPQLQETLALFQ